MLSFAVPLLFNVRIFLLSSGSRGDFQPLLALALALKNAGHDVLLTGGSSFEAEARAFSVPFATVGMDVRTWMAENSATLQMKPHEGAYHLIRLARLEVQVQIDAALPLAKGCDLVIGGGAMIAAPTIAAAIGAAFRYVAFTPQVFRSAEYAPFIFAVAGLPRAANLALWRLTDAIVSLTMRRPIDRARAALGLAPIGDLQEYFFPPEAAIIAADPELCPLAPDVPAPAPVGSFELPDGRPLPASLERFLDAGPPPVYVGFGSMPDPDPPATSRILIDAILSSGARAVLSRGWAGFDSDLDDERIHVCGPVSHTALLPRCAAVVHHGGAGTTHAAARAGAPQVFVPHAFDQFQFARWCEEAGVSAGAVPRTKLRWRPLAEAIDAALRTPALRSNAAALGARVRARNGVEATVRLLERSLATKAA